MEDIDALLRLVRARDGAAFEVLYDRFSRLVFGIAVRMLGDADTAEDVVQCVFLKLWNAPDSFRGGNFAAWLARITRNQALDHLRRRARRQTQELAADLPDAEHLDDLIASKFQARRIRQALAEIPDEQRLPIELGFFGGITHEEIARRIATPLGTVKTRIRAGLQKLRHSLRDEVAI